jgi:glycosyltransferase involved in cell wall biosynthesis
MRTTRVRHTEWGSDPESLRILVALQYYLPHRTGLTLHVQRLAEGLARRGHAVTVLTSRFDRRLAARETRGGVRVVRLWAPLRVSRGVVMPGHPIASLRLLREADVVSMHTPMPEAAPLALLARALGRGVVITHHGDLVLPRGACNRAVEWANLRLHGVAARAAHRLVAYSDDYRAHSPYLAPWDAKVAALRPPIAIPAPRPERVAALRRAWRAREGAPLVGFAGRFVEEKRPDVLIGSLAALRRRHPHARIVFAGQTDVPYEGFFARQRALVEAHRDALVFLGLLDDPRELADFYAACDVLALPSDTECMALVQAEAMLCGTPVVATDVPGAREVVRLTGMGRLVPRRDPVALGAALADVIDARDAHVRPRAEIAAVFDLEATLGAYERELRASLSRAALPSRVAQRMAS